MRNLTVNLGGINTEIKVENSDPDLDLNTFEDKLKEVVFRMIRNIETSYQ